MARAAKPKRPTPVEALKHRDKRANIPTEELREFVRTEEEAPGKKLYPRDDSLDPQLVWKGKDEQDSQSLEVPVVPIYIQEKIHPQALIENLRQTAQENEPEPELTLFDDFNGVKDFRQKIDFYGHDLGNQPKWSNRMILGDSLLVMTSLAEKEGLKGKVQMIYMDPPYGIKFGSNWQVSTRKREVKDGKAEDASRQPEQVKAYRDTWALGIHSYLAYLRDRLVTARELLTESGSAFVQIGDENVHLVRCVMDEVFGSDGFIAQICFRKTTGSTATNLPSLVDVLLVYAKDRARLKFRKLYLKQLPGEIGAIEYKRVELSDGTVKPISQFRVEGRLRIPEGARIFTTDSIVSKGGDDADIALEWRDRRFVLSCKPNRHWKAGGTEGIRRLWSVDRLLRQEGLRIYKRYLNDFSYRELANVWLDTRGEDEPDYVVQTDTKVVERCLLMTTDPGDLVLDPTCGSGTTAVVAEHWGRRWITIDTSRVALTLARTRLMTTKYSYYLLADSAEGRQKDAEVSGSTAPLTAAARVEGDIKKGFVYERVPHIKLESIANNEEIDEIHARFEEKLLSLRERLNRALRQSWEEWQVPREAEASWEAGTKRIHAEWWELRRQRQAEIDACIARRADVEYLFDLPYKDGKRLRVTGPFTVESLSPHRVLATEEERPASEATAQQSESSGQFVTMILDNLRKAGVQNTKRRERLTFDRLEPYAGAWLHAAGEYTDAAGRMRRVAISVGPEHGTVGPAHIQEAAKEAVRGIGFDLLLVLGFAFDAHAAQTVAEINPPDLKIKEGFVAEHEEHYGRLPVLLVRMNPDLSMGDELLKKTGSGNLFMVFGEPDVTIQVTPDGRFVVTLRGLDVYDPTTGQVRNGKAIVDPRTGETVRESVYDVACWFIDTDYNGESFFVRHAYFTGTEEPYDRLKRALRADIAESAWESLYSIQSRPFDLPRTGKIAIKVINHYGDEVLKVYDLRKQVDREGLASS